MNTVTITDTSGDKIEVSEMEGELLLDADAAENYLDREEAIRLRGAINDFLGWTTDEPDNEVDFYTDEVTPNEAKLRLAALMGLKAKFAYAGERDYRSVPRRIEPDTVEERNGVTYVLGESYDEGGASEGIRQFRLDRISGEVVVR